MGGCSAQDSQLGWRLERPESIQHDPAAESNEMQRARGQTRVKRLGFLAQQVVRVKEKQEEDRKKGRRRRERAFGVCCCFVLSFARS